MVAGRARKVLTEFQRETLTFCKSFDSVILSAAKDPIDADREMTLANLLTGKLHSEKAWESDVTSRMQGSFALLRMTKLRNLVRFSLRFNNLVPDGVTHESAERRYFEFAHDFRSMVLYRSRADVQQRSDFLVALAFRQQLNDLSLP